MLHLSLPAVKAMRLSNDATVVLVTWTVTDEKVTKLSLDVQEGDARIKREEGGKGGWKRVAGATGMGTNRTEFKVEDLSADEKYKFRMDMRRPGEEGLNPCEACYVESNVGRSDHPLTSYFLQLQTVLFRPSGPHHCSADAGVEVRLYSQMIPHTWYHRTMTECSN